MNETKYRQTKQRKVILEELRKTKTHPTAEELFFLVKKHIPNISLGTIYRNLDFLKKQKQILELSLEKNFNHYDGNIQKHYHFYCKKCKKIFDIYQLKIFKNLENMLLKKHNFYIEDYTLNFYGYCANCKKNTK
jgi:Fe2+ or Zn2+ uptake regulation protein